VAGTSDAAGRILMAHQYYWYKFVNERIVGNNGVLDSRKTMLAVDRK
jgi:hypothetical protein